LFSAWIETSAIVLHGKLKPDAGHAKLDLY
jgi:hypothetical protein